MRHSACSFFGEALTYHLLKVVRLEPRLNRNVFRGFRLSGLWRTSDQRRRHPRLFYLFFFVLHD
ncbi:hypothetical protein AA450_04895 [Salmonella enterica subsp. enterica serovar Give]|nr:hypothetical protein [Salmonella enterica]EBP4104086.1 hypothetical protein [Salmonella enterica subsp. enterica]ECO0963732.1 hypothetical protein [Salmonella enterica subsp. enterica serovar Give]